MHAGLLVLDTLRYDVSEREMPALRRRAAHRFENAHATARWTSPSHASLFTGLYPTEVGVHAGSRHLTTPKPTLAEQFRDAGYDTVAFSDNVNVDPFFGFDRGFDAFHRGPSLAGRPLDDDGGFDWGALETRVAASGPRRYLGALYHIATADAPTVPTLRTGLRMFRAGGDDDGRVDWAVDHVRDAVEGAGEDLFLFGNLMPCHYPYEPPASYRDVEPLDAEPLELLLRDDPVTDGEHARHWECYRGAARYLDDALGRVLDATDWDLLFVVSDHGELFGEHDLRGHYYGVYDELTHVPAWAFGDAVPAGRTTAPVSLLDVHRTLLAAAGIDPDADARGVDLFGDGPVADRPLYAESEGCEWYAPDATGLRGRVPASWADPHYVYRTPEAVLLADKDGTRAVDPDSGEALPAETDRLVAAAGALRDDRGTYGGDGDARETPEAIERRLADLGYR